MVRSTKCFVIINALHNAPTEILLLLRLQIPEPRILRHVPDHLKIPRRRRGPLVQAAAAALPGRQRRQIVLPERPCPATRNEAEQHGVSSQNWLVSNVINVFMIGRIGVGMSGGCGG